VQLSVIGATAHDRASETGSHGLLRREPAGPGNTIRTGDAVVLTPAALSGSTWTAVALAVATVGFSAVS
jgi:hypothetical protein